MPSVLIGEIRIFPFNVVPDGWLVCDGSELSRTEYPELFSIIGETFGSDNALTFKLPNMRGRVALHANETYPLGTEGGESEHTLTFDELPEHSHPVVASLTPATAPSVVGSYPAIAAAARTLYSEKATGFMSEAVIDPEGGDAPHNNMQPFIVLNFCICASNGGLR